MRGTITDTIAGVARLSQLKYTGGDVSVIIVGEDMEVLLTFRLRHADISRVQ